MRSYLYKDLAFSVGDFVQVCNTEDKDDGHVGKVTRVRTGGVVVQFGGIAETHRSVWHPANLRIVKEHE